jgi:HdeA/HdeB family
MKFLAATLLISCVVAQAHAAAPLNLATLSCDKYENEVLRPAGANQSTDAIDTVMWMFGFAVAKSGASAMYGDALSAFGFALDDQCKKNPGQTMLAALAVVPLDNKNPMDLSTLRCSAFASRHTELMRSDAQSANTIMMWLYGFSVAKSGGHMLDADSVGGFGSALLAECGKHPAGSLLDALNVVKISSSGQ